MDNSNEFKKVTLYSYSKAWNVEKKVYSVMNFVLPAPINPYTALVYILVLVFYMTFEKILPFLAGIPVILKYFVFPYFGAQYLMKKKLDGKNPIKYIAGLIQHFVAERTSCLEGFERIPNVEPTIHIDWSCSKGYSKQKGGFYK